MTEQLNNVAKEMFDNPATIGLAHFRPTQLADFLANGESDAVARFVVGVDALLMEMHGGDRWAFFSNPGFGSVLEKIGLLPAAAWQP